MNKPQTMTPHHAGDLAAEHVGRGFKAAWRCIVADCEKAAHSASGTIAAIQQATAYTQHEADSGETYVERDTSTALGFSEAGQMVLAIMPSDTIVWVEDTEFSELVEAVQG